MKVETDREKMIVIRWRMRGQTEALGPSLDRAYPTDDEAPSFEEALEAIDEAERKVWGDPPPEDEPPE